MLQPRFLSDVLKEVVESKQQEINAGQKAVATLAASQIVDKNGKHLYSPIDLLPYPVDESKLKNPKECVSPATAKVMQRLIDNGRLPTLVEAAAKARLAHG